MQVAVEQSGVGSPALGEQPVVGAERTTSESEEERFAAYAEMEAAAPLEVAEASPSLQPSAKAEPSLTLQDAAKCLSPKVLQALEDQFNGSLTEVRAPDDKDQFF